MSGAKNQTDRPKYPGKTSADGFDKLTGLLRAAKNDILKQINKGNFKNAATAAKAALDEFDNLERETEGSFCMTRHILESAGYAAKNAISYQKNTMKKTDPIMKELIASQVQLIDAFGPEIDREAQKTHRSGIGIICNDLPSIPF